MKAPNSTKLSTRFAQAAMGVSSAGEQHSLNWFDTARELTERWHHQQQIRQATRRPGLMVPEVSHPVLDCFHAWPAVCLWRGQGATGAEVSGECGGARQIRKESTRWKESAGWELVKPGKSTCRETGISGFDIELTAIVA